MKGRFILALAALASVIAPAAASADGGLVPGVNPPTVPSVTPPALPGVPAIPGTSANPAPSKPAHVTITIPRPVKAVKICTTSRKTKKRHCTTKRVYASTTTTADVQKGQTFTAEDPCVQSETVVVQGTIRHRFTIAISDSGSTHITDYYTAQGSGSGFLDFPIGPQVASYQFSDEQLQESTFAGTAGEATSVFRTKVIRLSETIHADDFFDYSTVHMTMANGVFTADIADDTIRCG